MSHPEKTQNESALACAARQGDHQATQALLVNNWLWLKGLVYNVLGSPGEVDDVLQQICILVLEKVHTLREPERFKPWLAAVARHAALAHREKQSKKPAQLTELLAAQQAQIQPDLADELARNEQCGRILQALKQLPDKYREVFILKHLQDMTYAQIAEIMEITVTTVQIRLVRARRMIYNTLTGRPNDKVPRT